MIRCDDFKSEENSISSNSNEKSFADKIEKMKSSHASNCYEEGGCDLRCIEIKEEFS